MGSVYVYEADTDDFSTIGICGALTPTKCTFHEIANGKSSVEMEHPLDVLKRYTCLQENRIIKCDVPVRTAPEIANGQFVTVVEKWKVRDTASKNNRYLYRKEDPEKGGRSKLLPVGAEVIVVAKYEDPDFRWKVDCTWFEDKKVTVRRDGKSYRETVAVGKSASGFINHDSSTIELIETVTIEDSPFGIEAVAPSWRIREQLFRIVKVEKTEKSVKVEADHISYDLMYNLANFENDENMTMQDAADSMLDSCFDDHDFTFQTNIKGEKAGFHFRDKDPITALLDPDIGIVPRWSGEIIRDNFQFTVLDQAGVNRGTMFTYGKNVKGVSVSIDFSDVATAIRPVGEDKKGKPLYLEHSYLWDGETATALEDEDGIVYGRWHYLDNGVLRCRLPHARIFPLEGEDCTEDKKEGLDIATVRARLLDQSIEQLREGGEDPETTVKVDMQMLGYTQQWSMYRELEKVFLFDTVRVRHPGLNIDLETPVSEIEWDCIYDMPLEITTGPINDLTSSVASWQIKSVDGAKLIHGTVDSGQLADGAVVADHIRAGAVTADAGAANSITANKIAAGAITTEKLDAEAVTAAKIKAQTITGNQIAANTITGNNIAAATIQASNIASKTITADQLMANLITATSGLIADGAIITAQIKDGSITAAKIVSLNADVINAGTLSVERLLIVGENGIIYRINAESSGLTQEELTDEQYQNQINGTVIVAESITADQIAAAAITANHLTANAVTAAKVDIADLFASQAFITALTTSQIFTDPNTGTLRLVAQQASETRDTLARWFIFDDERGLVIQKPAYTDDQGVQHDASIWYTVTDEIGYHIYSTQQLDAVGSFKRGGLHTTGVQIGDVVAKKTSNGDWVWTDPT